MSLSDKEIAKEIINNALVMAREKKEFNLSEKREIWTEDIKNQNTHGEFFWEEDVKKFVRKLKEKLQHTNGCGKSCNEGFSDSFNCGDGHLCFECEYDLFHKIDNLAGDKLI